INLGNQIVMVVDAPVGLRYYWKSSTFDTYQNGRWTTSASAEQQVGSGGITLSHAPVQAGARREVTQRFVITMGASRLVYAAPQLKTIRLPIRVELNFVDRGSGLSDPLTFWAGEPLLRGAQYSVVSSVSVARAEFLRQTGSQYPAWVTSRYLQLPPEITPRTRDLAQQIVRAANAQTPYDKAKAIETWLRQNIAYSESVGNPPVGRDPIDWMLFERREAYCTYYASAMIAMLRSLSVPARMAAGFSQGVYDPENRYFVVRERDAHTWVEVYFNGAGWVEFEPTAAQSVINRTEIEQMPPTPTPMPTATPSPTPTPTPTPTLTATATPTFTPTAAFPFMPLRTGFTRFEGRTDCDFQGISGIVLGLQGERLSARVGIQAQVIGNNFAQRIPIESDSVYGWVIQVGTRPRRATYRVQLLSREDVMLSPAVSIQFDGKCERNLAQVDFSQTRPF
ncbi:MAG: transglutaminase-like domain-containing protein, partial [Aggregatilineales bacterium]